VKRILGLCLLICAALLVCVLGVGAFMLAEIRHIQPLWVFVSLISIGFFVGAREEYRREFHSARFLFFVCFWLVVNAAVFVAVIAYLGWLYLIPFLFAEQVLFYMAGYWLFGLEPPLRRRKVKY